MTQPLTITVPAVTGTHPQNSSLPVTWTTNQALSVGQFAVWVEARAAGTSASSWPLNGTASYSTSVSLAVPPGSGYFVTVGYRPSPAAAPGRSTAAAAGPSRSTLPLTITVPAVTGSYPQNSSLPVTWTTNQALSVGQFAVWVRSASGLYVGKLVAVNGTASYSTSVSLSVPPGSGYFVTVGYRPVAGSGSWTVYGSSSGTFTVTLPLTITVSPVIGTYAQNSSLPVFWTTSQALSVASSPCG